jgi:hypothetical protein
VRAAVKSQSKIMPPELTPETWTQVRYEYEHTEKPVEDICVDHGISSSTLRDRMRRWRWTRRRQPIAAEGPPPMPIEHAVPLVPAVAPGETAADALAPLPATSDAAPGDPAVIVPRLQGAVARVLPAIEATVAKLAAGPMQPREMERAARTLTSLTRTLRELNELLKQHPAPAADRGRKDTGAFIQELVRRMDAFAARRKANDQQEGSASAQA